MKIICDTCGAKYSIADEKVRNKVFKIRCKKCQDIIVVRGTVDSPPAEEQAPAEGGGDYGGAAPGYDAGGPVWHVVLDGEQQGPYTAEQVAQFVAAGQLDYESYCWRDGFGDWVHLREIEELVQAISGAPAEAAGDAAFQDSMPTMAGADAQAQAGGFEDQGAYEQPAAQEPDPYAATAAMGAGQVAAQAAAQAVQEPEEPVGFTAPESSGAPAATTAQEAVADLFGSSPAPTPAAEPTQDEAASAAAGAGFAAPSASPQAARGAGHDVGADLFAQQDEGGDGMFPADASADVVTSSPRVEVGRMTGTRNENSVLFSLSNLQALASNEAPAAAAPVGAVGAAAAPMAAPSPGGGGTTEGSGLIDIKSMAAAAVDTNEGSGGGVDDLLSIGGGGGFAPTLGAPVLVPQAPEKSNKALWAVVALVAILVIAGAAVAIVLILSGDPDEPTVAAAQQQILSTQPSVGTNSPASGGAATNTSNTGTGAASSSSAASDEGEGSDGSDDSSSGSASRTKRDRDRDRDTSSSATKTDTSSAPAVPAPAAPAGKGSRDLNALLAGAIGDGPSPAKAKTPPPTDSSLPAKLSRGQVKSGMSRVSGAVARCGRGQSGRVTVTVTINGSSGRVSNARVSGQFAGTPVGSCAARAVRGARFPRFRDKSLTVRGYPFVLR